MGSLVVLLLAERARSEGARSTRALEDQPGYPVKEVGVERRRAVKDSLARGEVQGQAMTTVLPSAMRRGWFKASYRSPFKQAE